MTDPSREVNQLLRMLSYNAWANSKLIEFCRALGRDGLRLTAAGTLGPIERTLTHLVSSEQFYLRDLTGEDPPAWIESKVVPIEEVAARAGENAARWAAYLELRPDPDEEFETSWRGNAKRVVRWERLLQAIVHGVEHRSHACTILGANGIEPADLSVGAYEDEIARSK